MRVTEVGHKAEMAWNLTLLLGNRDRRTKWRTTHKIVVPTNKLVAFNFFACLLSGIK